ncbi:MAG TPA: MXAN_5808 family serine peptidase [Anaeromyxobacteraceae bacterium]|nr:MXAN_5808 family serine peptidase [Anaeromyxobacteraceae bacterium]
MIRPFRIVATLAAAAALFLGTSARISKAEAGAASTVAYRGSGTFQPKADEQGPYQLDKLLIASKAILNVTDFYVDPARIEPKEMFVGALQAMERTVAEVMVDGDARSDKVKVTVGSASREFPIQGLDTVWKMRTALGEVMSFVQQHLVAHEDLKQIEYSASNGFLQRLDPHSLILEPRQYRDMKVTTRGEFGGLGFVITMRDGNLTVVRVLRNTPAQKAGIRAKDLINKIEEQSTINMDLNDAVDRLRGRPNTKVAITVTRAGWTEPKRLVLTREVINYETVSQAKLLEGGVGYVRLSQFSGNTTRDLRRAIDEQTQAAGGKLKGFVLDLRGNPGGLLDQATDVSDVFLSRGTIVKTVGDGSKQKVREVREASADSDDLPDLPLVVIVNSSSASASEIVAGALKNDGRALVIGRQTFGKGSVQQLFEFVEPGSKDEEGALKLTTAQYLTPGDISIQEIGITPDVLLLPGRVQKDQVTHFAPPRAMGEADLDGHFTNGSDKQSAAGAGRRTAEKPALELRYVLDEKGAANGAAAGHGGDLEISAEQAEDEASEANPDEFVEDYQIQFARDLLERAPYNARAKLLEAAKGLVQERRAQEEERLRKRFAGLGVDWSAAAAARGAPRANVTVTPSGDREARAGDTVRWTVTVENVGDAPYRQLRAWTTSEKNLLLDRREFVFGTVLPGERRSWSVPVKLPRGFDSRRDEVVLHFEGAGGKAPADVRTTFSVVEIPKPVFAFSLQVEDSKTGNGDGLPQRGEAFTVRVDVRNAGAGPSGEKTYVSLKNLGDEKAFIVKGRDVLGTMAPGETKSASLQIDLRKGSKAETLPLRIAIVDEKNDEFEQEKVEIPIAADATPTQAAKGAVRIEAGEALLRTGASASAAPIATAKRGTILPFDARVGDFYRVEWKKGRVAFAAEADVKPATGRQGVVAEAWQHEPPRITLDPDPSRGAPAVDAATFRLTGVAAIPPSADPDARLRDVFVFVNDKKVFFKVVPENQTSPRMEFQADVPLKPGNNLVTVFAREDEDFQTRRSFYVLRRGSAQAAQAGQPAPAAAAK